MDMTTDRHDRIMTVVFGQMEILQELAIKAGDVPLAQDLSAALANALYRFYDEKGGVEPGMAAGRQAM